MVYILSSDSEESGPVYDEELGIWVTISRMGSRWPEYKEYLESIKDKLPPAAYEIVTSDWHMNFNNPRSFHDSWVEKLTISEVSTEGKRGIKAQRRRLDIFVRLLGPYHDRYHELRYVDVQSYSLSFAPKEGNRYAVPHSDWLVDEFRLSESGYMIHEIEFRSDARWLIECKGFSYEEKPRHWPRALPLDNPGERIPENLRYRPLRYRPSRFLPRTPRSD